MTGLVDAYGKPVSTARYVPGNSRDAGSFRAPLSGWRGPMLSGRADAAPARAASQQRADSSARPLPAP